MSEFECIIIDDCLKYANKYRVEPIIVLGVYTAEKLLHEHGMDIYGMLRIKGSGNNFKLQGFNLDLGDFDYGYIIR